MRRGSSENNKIVVEGINKFRRRKIKMKRELGR